MAAIALVGHLPLVEDIGVEALERQFHHILRRLARAEQLGDGGHGGNVLFQLRDLSIGRTGQELDEVAARTGNGQIGIHQHAQSADRGDLLAVGVVAGQILRDLAGDQRHLPDGGLLLQPVIADDGHNTVSADSPADVQVAVFLERKLHQRVVDAALHVAGAVGARDQHTRRAVTGDAQGDGIAVILEHRAHHGGTRQQTAKGRAASGAGFMELFGFADDLGRVHAAEHDAAVLRQAADQIRHIIVPPIGYTA